MVSGGVSIGRWAGGAGEQARFDGRAEAGDVVALESRPVVQRDRAGTGQGTERHPPHGGVHRCVWAPAASTLAAGALVRRAGGDLARPGGGPVVADDRSPLGPGGLDDQPRDRPPRWPPPLSRDPRRRAGLAAGPAAEAVQARRLPAPARARRRQARARVVAPADLRLACPDPSRRARSRGVDGDDLPEPVHPGPGRAAQGAHGPPAHPAHDAPLTAVSYTHLTLPTNREV